MNTFPYQQEIVTFKDPDIQHDLGEMVLRDLVWAVEKKTYVTEYEEALNAASRKIKRARPITETLVQNWSRINSETTHQRAKFERRKSNAELYLASDISVEVADIEGNSLAAGILEYVDYKTAMLALKTPEGESTYLPFAERKPVPEDIDQSYYGHIATVALRVISVSADENWRLTHEPLC